jgi:hypothetical protein
MTRPSFALCAAVLTITLQPTPVFAQEAQPTCVYDPAAEQFRAYRGDADASLLGETLVGRERPEAIVIDGQRFQYSEPLRGTADDLNRLVQPRGMVDGVRYFGVADAWSDLTAAVSRPEYCMLEAYRYAPIVHGVWVMEQPFVFSFPALAVDRASFRKEGDRARGIGFLMRGHPHPEQDPSLYYRQTIESDCAAERTRIIDTRSYAAENTLHQRFPADDADWVPNDDLTHPATRVLANLICKPPAEWPDNTRLESLDKFSEQVHQAAHAGR